MHDVFTAGKAVSLGNAWFTGLHGFLGEYDSAAGPFEDVKLKFRMVGL